MAAKIKITTANDSMGHQAVQSALRWVMCLTLMAILLAVGLMGTTIATTATGFPSTGVLDDFNRANGGLGANWSGSTGGYSLAGSQMNVGAGGDLYWKAGSFGANQEVYVTLAGINPSSNEIDLLLKSQSNTYWGSGVIEVWYAPANKRVQVWTYTSAQGWVQRGADITVTLAPGDQFGALATADGTVQVYQNGSLLGTRDVTGWPWFGGGGYIGLWCISAANTVMDNFGGGTALTATTATATATPSRTSVPPPTGTMTPTATQISGATVSPTPTASPTPTRTPSGTASLTPTGSATAAFTATPSATLTVPVNSATPTATGTPSSVSTRTFFSVGPGSTDVIPHQIVRTSDDRLYLFAGQEYAATIHVYWTTAAGLPADATVFSGATQLTASGDPISLEAAYDGGHTVHVLVNLNSGPNAGHLVDYPFDITLNAFKPAITLAADTHTVAGDYVGSSGVSGMVDRNGSLQVAYWSNGNHIVQQAYSYSGAANTLTPVGAVQQVDTLGGANHPVLAISPVDDSVTVGWVSQATSPARILVRTWTAAAGWGAVATVSTAPVWTSIYFGLNIDQGPSLLIGPDGARHLTYIENWDATHAYGRIHYVSNATGVWTDTALNTYSHDPALAVNNLGVLYIIGHGHPNSQNTTCVSMQDMCTSKMNADGTWGGAQLFAAHSGSNSFDGSPSVKWSLVGFNRPEAIEFAFFSVPNGDYAHPTIYYGRLSNP